VAEYTHLNLKDDVDDAAAKFGLSPNMETHFARDPMGLQGGGLSVQRYAPNFRAPIAHRHRDQEEVYVVVSGGGRVKIEDEVRELRQWDALRVPPQTARAFEAGPDGLELIAIGFAEGGDTEMLEDFWDDAA
jgi:mannose-6-phosphate isomerase-like protein (cupin superfamily)